MSFDPQFVQHKITAFWNLVATDYDVHPGNVPAPGSAAYRAWMDAVRAALPEAPSDVLDVGTGTGFVALIAASLGHRVTGIDLAEGMLAVARAEAERRCLHPRLLVGDAVTPDFPAGSFDVVVSRSLVWTLRELDRAVVGWHRVLRPRGRVIMFGGFSATPEPARPQPDEGETDDADPAAATFLRYYSDEIRAALPAMHLSHNAPVVAALQRAGFTDITATRLAQVEEADPTYSPDRPPYVLVAYRP